MKLIAITLAGLFLVVTLAPADASARRTDSARSTFVQKTLIPGAQGCCG